MAKTNHKLSALDRLVQHAVGEGQELGLETDPTRQSCPELWKWLTQVYVGRDYLKQPATLTVRLGPQGVLASLVDRDLCASVDVSCAHLEQVFGAMEAALTGEHPPVKSWGKREPHLRKRRAN